MEPIKFGKYVLVDLIAAGGMAEIYKAVMKIPEGPERSLAVKRILPQFARDEEFISLMIDEAKVMVFMNHPNIVPIVEFGKVDGNYYIAMEFVQGPTLLTLFRRVRERGELFPVPIALHIVREVADALGYAHRKTDQSGTPLDIVHRDISPANILLSYHGDVKITDFGISKASTQSHQTQIGIIRGKTGYMSPEQTRSGMVIDGRTDLFALGVILFELITGERLYKADTIPQALKMIREAPVPSLRQFRPEVPIELEDLVQKALAKEPNDRYQTGEQFRDAINEFLTKSSTSSLQLRRVTHNDLSSFLKNHFPEEANDATVSILDDMPSNPNQFTGSGASAPPEVGEPMATSSKVFAVNPWFETRYQSAPKAPPSTVVPEIPITDSGVQRTATMMAPAESTRMSQSQRSINFSEGSGAVIRPPEATSSPNKILLGVVGASIIIGGVIGAFFMKGKSPRDPITANPTPMATLKAETTPAPATTPIKSEAKSIVVKMTSKPPGAKIVVDNKVYQSPANVELDFGKEVFITAKLAGHADKSLSYMPDDSGIFEIELEKSTVRPVPTRKPGSVKPAPQGEGYLTIGSIPWSNIYLSGKNIGVAPLLKKPTAAGKYTIRLENPGEKLSLEYSVTLKPYSEMKCLFDLRKKTGSCKPI